MTVMPIVAGSLLVLAGALTLVALLRAETVLGRLVVLDVAVIVIVSSVAVHAAATGSGHFLDVVVVATLLSFVGTAAVARSVERRDQE